MQQEPDSFVYTHTHTHLRNRLETYCNIHAEEKKNHLDQHTFPHLCQCTQCKYGGNLQSGALSQQMVLTLPHHATVRGASSRNVSGPQTKTEQLVSALVAMLCRSCVLVCQQTIPTAAGLNVRATAIKISFHLFTKTGPHSPYRSDNRQAAAAKTRPQTCTPPHSPC